MKAKDCWPDAASPISVVPPISIPTLLATAHTMHPSKASAADPMKNHLIVSAVAKLKSVLNLPVVQTSRLTVQPKATQSRA